MSFPELVLGLVPFVIRRCQPDLQIPSGIEVELIIRPERVDLRPHPGALSIRSVSRRGHEPDLTGQLPIIGVRSFEFRASMIERRLCDSEVLAKPVDVHLGEEWNGEGRIGEGLGGKAWGRSVTHEELDGSGVVGAAGWAFTDAFSISGCCMGLDAPNTEDVAYGRSSV